ncbi:MAG: hypothetical protein JWN56_2439 [Sphingobacteriales bacterium]|nr:hypothetical protein [Sphingobacteriales bacterium]
MLCAVPDKKAQTQKLRTKDIRNHRTFNNHKPGIAQNYC